MLLNCKDEIEVTICINGPQLRKFLARLRNHLDYIDNPQRIMLDELIWGFDEYTLLDFNNAKARYVLTDKGRTYFEQYQWHSDI